jgi:cobyrinic acid a,c-diamide synthase
VQALGRRIAGQVDLARVRALAATAEPWPGTPAVPSARAAPPHHGPRLRIGIARDRAFGFYYPDDLAALQAAGADLVFIDTLHDQRLPLLDGLFIGGGFPEASARALEANHALRAALRRAIEAGLPTYAECGGLMYLSRGITTSGGTAQMVGVIPGDAVMQARPVGRGYVQLQATEHLPWPLAEGSDGCVRGHEFHHSSLDNLPPGLRFGWRVQRGHGIDGRHDGLVLHNLLASYSHLRSGAGSDWVPRFMAHVRRHRDQCAVSAALAA